MLRQRAQVSTHQPGYMRSRRISHRDRGPGGSLSPNADEKNIVQRYWPCFAIIYCSILFSIVGYTVIFLTEDTEYPLCGIPESLQTPPADGEAFLTFISVHDASHSEIKLYHKSSENEKTRFWNQILTVCPLLDPGTPLL